MLRRRFTVRTERAKQPIPDEERVLTERILARLVARAYAADHPHLFGRSTCLPCAARPTAEAKALAREERTGGGGMA